MAPLDFQNIHVTAMATLSPPASHSAEAMSPFSVKNPPAMAPTINMTADATLRLRLGFSAGGAVKTSRSNARSQYALVNTTLVTSPYPRKRDTTIWPRLNRQQRKRHENDKIARQQKARVARHDGGRDERGADKGEQGLQRKGEDDGAAAKRAQYAHQPAEEEGAEDEAEDGDAGFGPAPGLVFGLAGDAEADIDGVAWAV